jgi:hypothetical protein
MSRSDLRWLMKVFGPDARLVDVMATLKLIVEVMEKAYARDQRVLPGV